MFMKYQEIVKTFPLNIKITFNLSYISLFVSIDKSLLENALCDIKIEWAKQKQQIKVALKMVFTWIITDKNQYQKENKNWAICK